MSDRFKVLSSDRRFQAWRNPDTYCPPTLPSLYPRQLTGPRGIEGSDDPSYCISNNHGVLRFVKGLNSDPAAQEQFLRDWENARIGISRTFRLHRVI